MTTHVRDHDDERWRCTGRDASFPKRRATAPPPHTSHDRRAKHNACATVGDVEDELRSDWRDGTRPSADQATALRDARQAIAQAKAALDGAVR